MYAQPQAGGTATAKAQAPTLHVGSYRRALLSVIIGNNLFSEAEQVLTNHNAHECADATRLALWCKNARRVAAERQEARNKASLAGMEQAITRFNQRVADKLPAAPAEQLTPPSTALVPAPAAGPAKAAPAPTTPPAWVVTQGRITRAQRQELERRLLPQVGRSHRAAYMLQDMGNWSAARATTELLRARYNVVPHEVKRDMGFSVGYVMAPGLLPRRAYADFKCLRRVVLPTHRDYQITQPGERVDYCLSQN